ncbi:MAG: myo-inosose-2 dehydratase [SAR324 cluster bacterium]|nr:myo-inosose-2 dehydratase [SAR324 cluster bacterium]MBL7035521.1 myo-inosose-2 dehydratase [SAR324 cluster bacterium]
MFSANSIRLSIAPIAWTNDDLPELGGHISFEQCIDEMAAAGFSGSEIGNKYPRNPDVLKPALEKRGLQISSAWFSTYFSEEGRTEDTVSQFIQQMNFLKAMGAKIINICECGHSVQGTPKHVFDRPSYTDQQWLQVAEGLNRIGEMARENGMLIAYHYHMGTIVQTAAETDRLMEMTDSDLVHLLVDTGHAFYAGDDPLKTVQKYGPRIRNVHLKDIRQTVLDEVEAKKMNFLDSVKAGVFTVPGDGVIDFDPIFEALVTAKYQGWFVVEAEQDPEKANPLEYAKKARTFIREHAGI